MEVKKETFLNLLIELFPGIKTNIFSTALISLLSCSAPSTQPSSTWRLIAAREEEPSLERPLIYRGLVPSGWKRQNPLPNVSLADTKNPICEFYIQEEEETIRLTIHSFPIHDSSKRIPPLAQASRWKQQLEGLNEWTTSLTPESHAGFSGIRFEGEGFINQQPMCIIGWSMQIAPAYDKQLSLGKYPLDRYKRADYTIKASGPPKLMQKHREALLAFAHSFELIDELLPPL